MRANHKIQIKKKIAQKQEQKCMLMFDEYKIVHYTGMLK